MLSREGINQLYKDLVMEFVHCLAACFGEFFCIFLLLKCVDLGFNTNIAHFPQFVSICIIIFLIRIIRVDIKYIEHCKYHMNDLIEAIERAKKIQ